MKQELTGFYRIQRNIFGICPRSAEIFRLSDCKVYLRVKPKRDWKDELERKSKRLDLFEQKLDEDEEEKREAARQKGRREALRLVRQVDSIFSPRKLNPDDAKVLFHPVDYLVFDGMKNGAIKSLALLDRRIGDKGRRMLQRSVERAVEREKYEWITLRVGNNGDVREEN